MSALKPFHQMYRDMRSGLKKRSEAIPAFDTPAPLALSTLTGVQAEQSGGDDTAIHTARPPPVQLLNADADSLVPPSDRTAPPIIIGTVVAVDQQDNPAATTTERQAGTMPKRPRGIAHSLLYLTPILPFSSCELSYQHSRCELRGCGGQASPQKVTKTQQSSVLFKVLEGHRWQLGSEVAQGR